ncbi:short transient receptor potential channel 7-like [Babylonia areolata]|uniref:short transient receptor potential channel 7-like n=1 Tax=Babylonia areolata TaxID=304850 RepID=UPI003FCFD748
MLGVLSRIKMDMPHGARGTSTRGWRRRTGGSIRYSFKSSTSMDSQKGFGDVEEEFLHAAEFGDVPTTKRLLSEYQELNVDCIDALGRTALRLAVKNEHLEIVEVLLDRSSQHHIQEAVLQAISAGHIQIAETILKHRRYLEMWKERQKLGDTDGFYKAASAESQFSPDITPLILAAQKNQYEIVQLLYMRGEKIMKPHKFSCGCQECRNRMKFDQLRLAKYRLNAYRGLASEAYISLSSDDPILTAFELGAELKRLSRVEKHFKSDYLDLAEQLSDYTVKLLDRVRTQKELEMVLNKTGDPTEERYDALARFKLALKFKEKKFVAHASCQQRVVRTWYNGLGKWQRAGWAWRLFMTVCFVVGYPFLVFMHLIAPGTKITNTLKFPVVKFLCHTVSFMAFLMLIVLLTVESSASVSSDKTLANTHRDLFAKYQVLYERARNTTGNVSVLAGPDFPLRASQPTSTEIMMSLWIVGMIFQECHQIFRAGVQDHLSNLFNLLDFLLLSVYTSVFTIRFWTMSKFSSGMGLLRNLDITDQLDPFESSIQQAIYWLNADRMKWMKGDPVNMAEGMFAISNILSFSRISYLLPANEYLGPLQISLGRMLKDIMKFLALFSLVIVAFMVGLHNLFWYYSERNSIEIQYEGRPDAGEVKAEKAFGGVMATFRTVFWSLFGRGEPDAVRLGGYNNNLTEDVGYIIYGVYNIVMVTVLINMLIAMMTRSFTNIAEDSDVEWKFARSLLYMEYIGEGSTLPPPLNILGSPKAVIRAIFCRGCCFRHKEDAQDGQIMMLEEAKPVTSNGVKKRDRERAMEEGRGPGASASAGGGGGEGPSGTQGADGGDIGPAEGPGEGRARALSQDSPRHTASAPLDGSEEHLTYQQIMQKIIQRYIFDIQREAEVTEDDFEEIKQDILSFRFEILNQWKQKEALQDEMAGNVKSILHMLHPEQLKTPRKSRSLDSQQSISEEPEEQEQAAQRETDGSQDAEGQESETKDDDDDTKDEESKGSETKEAGEGDQ